MNHLENKTMKTENQYMIEIHSAICSYLNIEYADTINQDRSEEFNLPRQLTFYFLVENFKNNISLKRMAGLVNRKSHATVLNGHNRICNLYETESSLKKHIDYLKLKLFNLIHEMKSYINLNFEFVI